MKSFEDIKAQSDGTRLAFLKTEVALGLTFIKRAQYERGHGNAEGYERCKRAAIAAVESIERFKGRLPLDSRLKIEAEARPLIEAISTL